MLVRRVWPSRPTFDSPFPDLDGARREMIRVPDGVAGEGAGALGVGVFPPINISQDTDNFYVCAEIPGIKREDLQISAVRNRVLIAGKREIATEPASVSYHRRERAEGSFNRTLTLPVEVDAERVEARYVDGVLTLALPKAEAAKPRQIQVHS